jgi:hypothetical protein
MIFSFQVRLAMHGVDRLTVPRARDSIIATQWLDWFENQTNNNENSQQKGKKHDHGIHPQS